MCTIVKASQKFVWPSWIVYDQNFWQEAANVLGMQQAKVNPSINAQCLTGMVANPEDWCKWYEHPLDRCLYVSPWH